MGQKVSCCVCRSDSEPATARDRPTSEPAATKPPGCKAPEAAPDLADGGHDSDTLVPLERPTRPKEAASCHKSTRHCGDVDVAEDERPKADAKAELRPKNGSKLAAPRQGKSDPVEDFDKDGTYCSMGCASGRDPPTQSPVLKEALSGSRALQAKQLEIRALTQKLEALMQVRTQIGNRVKDDAGVSPPQNLLEENGVGQVLCRDDWVDRILKYEPAMHGVHAKMVNEACVDHLGGTNRLIDAQELDSHYLDLVKTVDDRTQQRISVINSDLQKLDAEVLEIEDLINELYESMADPEEDVIKKDRFVVVMCEEVTESESGEKKVCPKDAEQLFDHMAKGQQTLTFDQFKAELPHGCLVVVRGNAEDRRNKAKQYRNGWI